MQLSVHCFSLFLPNSIACRVLEKRAGSTTKLALAYNRPWLVVSFHPFSHFHGIIQYQRSIRVKNQARYY
jgi:hypothetical protein